MHTVAPHDLPIADTDTRIYETDNGVLLCGRHLGITPRLSGRDLGGEKIMVYTEDDIAEYRNGMVYPAGTPVCETCRINFQAMGAVSRPPAPPALVSTTVDTHATDGGLRKIETYFHPVLLDVTFLVVALHALELGDTCDITAGAKADGGAVVRVTHKDKLLVLCGRWAAEGEGFTFQIAQGRDSGKSFSLPVVAARWISGWLNA